MTMRSKKQNNRTDKTYHMQVRDLTVTISRRQIKNLNIYITPSSGEILVTAPFHVADAYIKNFLERKYQWMVEHKTKAMNRGMQEHPEITEEEAQQLKQLVLQYAHRWEPIMGVHCIRWTLRDMKTRWGSCSVQKRTIRINLQLAKKRPECVEYIVVHELTHLLEPSHNHRFKMYMTQFLPDWKERDQMLRQS